MTATFPHRYEIALERTASSKAAVEAPPRPPIAGGPPPEFDGDARQWSPEHLLLSSLALCVFTTFEALAARASLGVAGWSARASGMLDKGPDGLAFTSFRVEVLVTVAPADLRNAERVLARAEQHCIVTKALRVPVEVVAIYAPAGEP
jgi:organic hydroperoxide reductase OsmC/OhrA